MQISVKQLLGIAKCNNGFIGVVAEALGTYFDDPTYVLTQFDVTKIEAAYDRDFGTPAAIGSDTVFGPVTPEMYAADAADFYNQVIAANSLFGLLGFEFAKRDSTV
jgi:hypothetical protein